MPSTIHTVGNSHPNSEQRKRRNGGGDAEPLSIKYIFCSMHLSTLLYRSLLAPCSNCMTVSKDMRTQNCKNIQRIKLPKMFRDLRSQMLTRKIKSNCGCVGSSLPLQHQQQNGSRSSRHTKQAAANPARRTLELLRRGLAWATGLCTTCTTLTCSCCTWWLGGTRARRSDGSGTVYSRKGRAGALMAALPVWPALLPIWFLTLLSALPALLPTLSTLSALPAWMSTRL